MSVVGLGTARTGRYTGGYLAKSVAGSANITLSDSENHNTKFKLTGALTGAISVIFGLLTGEWLTIENATTGNFGLTIIGTSGNGVVLQQNEIGDFYFDGTDVKRVGDPYRVHVAKVALAALDTGGAALSWQNPEGVAIIIDRLELDVTTVTTGAGTISVGTTATNGTTSSANLIDTLDVNAATGLFDNITDKGTLGKSRQKLASGKWVTGSKASGALAGLVGFAYIHYHLA